MKENEGEKEKRNVSNSSVATIDRTEPKTIQSVDTLHAATIFEANRLMDALIFRRVTRYAITLHAKRAPCCQEREREKKSEHEEQRERLSSSPVRSNHV